MKTLDEQIESAERELAMRKRVYLKWVVAGKMNWLKARHEIECMESIIETLNRVATQPDSL